MNKSDELKKLQERVAEEKRKEEITKKQKELESQKNRRLESIQKAVNDYPKILKKFEESILKGETKGVIRSGYVSDMYIRDGNEDYNKKMAELLENDGFVVEWAHCKGWDASEVTSDQEPFNYICFYCK